MDDNTTELCERLISDIGKAILGEGTESLALVLSRCAALLQSQAARIQQQALEYVSLQAQCDEHLARIAELEREKDEAEKHAAVVSSENFDLEARIAELDRKHKEAWDDCGELNTANHELLAACGEKDRRIAELEKERDGLRSCVKEALAQCVFDMATDEDPLADRMRAALQTEKETRS